jgi:hypothetical protein
MCTACAILQVYATQTTLQPSARKVLSFQIARIAPTISSVNRTYGYDRNALRRGHSILTCCTALSRPRLLTANTDAKLFRRQSSPPRRR